MPKNRLRVVSIAKKRKKPVQSKHLQLKGFLSFLILHELKLKRQTGEDLAKRIGRRKGSMLTPGTIYPTLKKLRTSKMVKYTQFGRRKVYNLTSKGSKELQLLYKLFSKYFAGLKNKVQKKPLKPK